MEIIPLEPQEPLESTTNGPGTTNSEPMDADDTTLTSPVLEIVDDNNVEPDKPKSRKHSTTSFNGASKIMTRHRDSVNHVASLENGGLTSSRRLRFCCFQCGENFSTRHHLAYHQRVEHPVSAASKIVVSDDYVPRRRSKNSNNVLPRVNDEASGSSVVPLLTEDKHVDQIIEGVIANSSLNDKPDTTSDLESNKFSINAHKFLTNGLKTQRLPRLSNRIGRLQTSRAKATTAATFYRAGRATLPPRVRTFVERMLRDGRSPAAIKARIEGEFISSSGRPLYIVTSRHIEDIRKHLRTRTENKSPLASSRRSLNEKRRSSATNLSNQSSDDEDNSTLHRLASKIAKNMPSDDLSFSLESSGKKRGRKRQLIDNLTTKRRSKSVETALSHIDVELASKPKRRRSSVIEVRSPVRPPTSRRRSSSIIKEFATQSSTKFEDNDSQLLSVVAPKRRRSLSISSTVSEVPDIFSKCISSLRSFYQRLETVDLITLTNEHMTCVEKIQEFVQDMESSLSGLPIREKPLPVETQLPAPTPLVVSLNLKRKQSRRSLPIIQQTKDNHENSDLKLNDSGKVLNKADVLEKFMTELSQRVERIERLQAGKLDNENSNETNKSDMGLLKTGVFEQRPVKRRSRRASVSDHLVVKTPFATKIDEKIDDNNTLAFLTSSAEVPTHGRRSTITKKLLKWPTKNLMKCLPKPQQQDIVPKATLSLSNVQSIADQIETATPDSVNLPSAEIESSSIVRRRRTINAASKREIHDVVTKSNGQKALKVLKPLDDTQDKPDTVSKRRGRPPFNPKNEVSVIKDLSQSPSNSQQDFSYKNDVNSPEPPRSVPTENKSRRTAKFKIEVTRSTSDSPTKSSVNGSSQFTKIADKVASAGSVYLEKSLNTSKHSNSNSQDKSPTPAENSVANSANADSRKQYITSLRQNAKSFEEALANLKSQKFSPFSTSPVTKNGSASSNGSAAFNSKHFLMRPVKTKTKKEPTSTPSTAVLTFENDDDDFVYDVSIEEEATDQINC